VLGPDGRRLANVLADTQYTGADQTSTQNSLSPIWILPVPAGVTSLGAASGRIRYTINSLPC
jgi:hypothetical protein